MRPPSGRYSAKEVQTLVEEYEELKAKRGTEHSRLHYLIRLADLDKSIRSMPPKEYQAVLLVGLLGIAHRTAGRLLGVSKDTMHRRYQRGLEWLVTDINGGK